MQEIVMGLLPGLPTAAVLFYILVTNQKNHAKEREEWRRELSGMAGVLRGVTEQVNKLSFIIENYVIRNGTNPARKQD
ncbi:MAG: hypothetical protein LBH06_07470 [Rikenellaceae bacterium]|nr:hypothetical protein [Rikenellaceae bacterium]